ncbi:MAG: ABC transporter ATP-binding protein [Methanomicrobiales archaeon]
MMEPVLSVRDLKKTFVADEQECRVLQGISFEAFPGEILCIMGTSGCGKSTLLRMIAGLETIDSGSISTLESQGTGPARAAMVFQDDALFPWLNVHDNISYGLRLGAEKVPEDVATKRVADLLDLIGLTSFSAYYPYQLSGGMKQRAAVARALAVHPGIILMDEPFSALDPFTRRELQDEIIRIRDAASAEGHPVAILLVTHNPEEAVYLADRIIVLSDRPASIHGLIDVRLPRPRSIADKDFLAIREEVTGLVKR